jgi:hypothetical protein
LNIVPLKGQKISDIWGKTLRNENYIQEEIKSRWKSGNVCYQILQLAVQKYEDYDIQNYKFTCFLYGCETWSLTPRKEHRIRVFVNRVLRRIFEPRREEVTGEWRKLHNEELHDLYSLPNIFRAIKSKTMRWTGYVARMLEGAQPDSLARLVHVWAPLDVGACLLAESYRSFA